MYNPILATVLRVFAYAVSAWVALWTAAFAFYGLRKDRGRPFALLAAAVFLWNAAESAMVILLSAAGSPWRRFALELSAYLGRIDNLAYALIPALLYVFARGDGFRGLRGFRAPALLGAPLAANLVLWLTPMRPGGVPPQVEIAFGVQLAAGIVVIALAAWTLAVRAKNPSDTERTAVARILVGAFAFSVFFALFRAGVLGRLAFDPSPCIVSAALAFVATAYRRMDPFTAIAENEGRLRRFEFMVDASRDYMCIVNRDLRLEAVNATFCAAMGRTREELVGSTISAVWGAGPLSERIGPSFDGAFQGATVVYRVHAEFGLTAERDLEIAYYPFVPPGQAQPTHVAFVAKDITDYVRKELELEAARKAAVESEKTKGDFLANMSHEIRTPINAIMGLTELALKGDLGSELRDDLETVKAASRMLLALVNDILDLSKIESGRLRLERRAFSPAAAVEQVVKSFKPAVSRKGITLDFRSDEGVPALAVGDALRFSQILYNLVGNAVKFTERGGVTVSIAPERMPGEGVGVRVAVADSGIGIAPAKLETIFDSFTQADAGTTRRFGGTGLGLTISRHLARLLGGDISVESRLGEGSTFAVTVRFDACASNSLPVELPRAECFDIVEPPSPAATGRRSSPEGESDILLVEDNEMNARVVQRFLKTVGRTAVRASSGSEALDLLRGRSFAIVLMDVEMPGMDGLETTRRIRSGEAGESARDVLIIAMTAHSEAAARSRCAEAGMDDFISKPIEFAALESLLPGVAADPRTERHAVADDEDAPILDPKRTLGRLGGDEDLLFELYGVLLEEAKDRTQAALRAAEDKDYEALHRLAHKVKGSSASIGAERLALSAAALEKAAVARDSAAMDRAIGPFLSAYALTVREIGAALEGTKRS